MLDRGAQNALAVGHRSLLPGGILKVRGHFKEGQVVELEAEDGKAFGRGMVRYGSEDLCRIAGKKTGQIADILGRKAPDEVIHRNDLVIWSTR